jgi:ribosome-associated translation inhibitor RaiA
MRIDIQAKGFKLTEEVLQHTQARLDNDLTWAGDHVSSVMIRLTDNSGQRGGEEMRALVQIAMPGAQNVVVEDVRSHVNVAIDRALARARRAVVRQLGRIRAKRVQPDQSHRARQAVVRDDEMQGLMAEYA